jgi:hypothetical protein
MLSVRKHFEKWLRLAGIGLDPFASAVRKANIGLYRIVRRGTIVPSDIGRPILLAGEAVRAGHVAPDIEHEFYDAYSRLAKLAGHTEQDALGDSELLLKFGAETGVEVPRDIVEPILNAYTAHKAGAVSDAVTASFYAAYSKLAKLFGDVTADTIRACSSPETYKTLRRNRAYAAILTFMIAASSVFTFVADSMSRRILEDVASANKSAAVLRASLTPSGGSLTIDPKYASDDPCEYLDKPSEALARSVQNVVDVQQLQEFAGTVRDLYGRTLTLNWFLWQTGRDPFAKPGDSDRDKSPDERLLNRQLQLNPAILNYTAEVLCKIKTYQLVRTFATNVQIDYAAIVGAFFSYVLPIVYALLGAYAFRLRQFGDTIRKKTYHPSFSDSARMITAVIAGAIAGLFNPAQGLALSPLATAFLVGYGVELFFKFLDTLINAFGSPPVAGRRSSP